MVSYMVDYKNKNKEKPSEPNLEKGKVFAFSAKTSSFERSKQNVLKAAEKLKW